MDLSDWFGQGEASDVRVRIIVVESREALDGTPGPSAGGAALADGGATPAPRAKRPRPSDAAGDGRQPDARGAQQEQHPSDAGGAAEAEQRPPADGGGADPGLAQDGVLQLAARRRVHTELPGHTIVLCAGSPWARAKLRSQEHLQAGVRGRRRAIPVAGCRQRGLSGRRRDTCVLLEKPKPRPRRGAALDSMNRALPPCLRHPPCTPPPFHLLLCPIPGRGGRARDRGGRRRPGRGGADARQVDVLDARPGRAPAWRDAGAAAAGARGRRGAARPHRAMQVCVCSLVCVSRAPGLLRLPATRAF
jgi:hypothetical protein